MKSSSGFYEGQKMEYDKTKVQVVRTDNLAIGDNVRDMVRRSRTAP